MISTNQELPSQSRSVGSFDGKMNIKSIPRMECMPIRYFAHDQPPLRPRTLTQPRSPPESMSGSPRSDFGGPITKHSQDLPPAEPLHCRDSICRSRVSLPSLEEFDQGVEALTRSHGPARPYTPPSPLPSTARGNSTHASLPSLFGYVYSEVFHGHAMHDTFTHRPARLDDYPSPPPDAENRHINQKYTTEEGDFIIYAWHDKKLKWQRIKQDFAAMFGRTPERTVQGLQAWYYRMNQRIPMWDQYGWLIFDNEDDLEPRYISIKCRERDGQDKPTEPLGLAQRYPERAIHYSWVDPEIKRKSQDWGELGPIPIRTIDLR